MSEAGTISKELLKTALIELAQSDRDFLVSLVADALKDAAPAQGAAAPKIFSKRKKPPIEKIVPPYRQNVEELHGKYAIDESVLIKLQRLFDDAPPAEEIIATLSK